LLASIDWRLSVLFKGDKGSGKSSAARALADILPAGAPFVNLPIGTTEDRLLGGLDLSQALAGRASLKRGLIHEAHRGVLYMDEVNLLSDTLTDALLDVASSGRHYVERDGLSASADAEFILLGSMNIEEGALRPQLLDRFALSVEVEAPLAAEDRTRIVESRLQFDADPAAFCAAFEGEQERLRRDIAGARYLAAGIKPSNRVLQIISQAIAQSGVRSLRADLAALRAAAAHAALNGRSAILPEDIEPVLPLVLRHRAKRSPNQAPPPKSKPNHKEMQRDARETSGNTSERVFEPEVRQAPELRVSFPESLSRGRTAPVNSVAGKSLDVVASFTQSFRNTGQAALKTDQLVFHTPQRKSGVRFIFVIDASGSHAALQRMRAVKGVATALLESSVDEKDEVAVICFRGAKAEILLEPCRDAAAALRAFEFLPTGGRTPLAHALELAQLLITPASLLVLLTDGRANVPLRSADPWADTLEAAKNLKCPSVLVDSSLDASTAGLTEALAQSMGARRLHLDELNHESLMSVLRL
jgi:magnesium chelatase subunit D